LGKTEKSFEREFFIKGFIPHTWEIRPGAKEKIYNRINHQVLSMAGEEYLELPERIDLVETVYLNSALKKQYNILKSKLFLKINPNVILDPINAAVLANKLLQFCNGAIYYDDQKNWFDIHTLKLDALSEIIDENEGENILVAYSYRHDLERLLKRFPEAIVLGKDPKIIDKWNDGKIPLLLAHPGSCSQGINLQSGGSMIVWLGLNWNLEYDLQMNARLHRQGQARPVRVIRIITAGTIDEKVLEVLGNKNATQNDLLTALK